jgi:two-component system chemotaxis response regulator CheY
MGLNVLVVDDSMVARLAIKGIVKDSVASLAEASSGEAAIALVGEGRALDLVFLDLTMPGMGGVEALKELRSRVPSIKVVVVTADIQARTVEEVRALGAYDVIRKPADKAAVMAVLARAEGEGREP